MLDYSLKAKIVRKCTDAEGYTHIYMYTHIHIPNYFHQALFSIFTYNS